MTREEHIKLVGWLHIASGVLVLVGAVISAVAVMFGGLFSGDAVAVLTMPIVAVVVFIIVALFALPSLLAGKGLLEGKGWARVLAMILGFFALFNFPLGTALGVYTFWTLWGSEADPWFEPGYAGRTAGI